MNWWSIYRQYNCLLTYLSDSQWIVHMFYVCIYIEGGRNREIAIVDTV